MAGSTAHRFIGEMRWLDWQTVRGEGRGEVGGQHLSCRSNAKDDDVRMAGAEEKEREREKRGNVGDLKVRGRG